MENPQVRMRFMNELLKYGISTSKHQNKYTLLQNHKGIGIGKCTFKKGYRTTPDNYR